MKSQQTSLGQHADFAANLPASTCFLQQLCKLPKRAPRKHGSNPDAGEKNHNTFQNRDGFLEISQVFVHGFANVFFQRHKLLNQHISTVNDPPQKVPSELVPNLVPGRAQEPSHKGLRSVTDLCDNRTPRATRPTRPYMDDGTVLAVWFKDPRQTWRLFRVDDLEFVFDCQMYMPVDWSDGLYAHEVDIPPPDQPHRQAQVTGEPETEPEPAHG